MNISRSLHIIGSLSIDQKIKVNGKTYTIKKSGRKNKRYKAVSDEETLHFGLKGKKPEPYTQKANNYCNRTYYIKSSKFPNPNYFSRLDWACKGKKSKK